MPRSIFKFLSDENLVIRFPIKDLMSELEFVCMNLWAAERIRAEVAAMLSATFTPEELSTEHLERLRFSFWQHHTTHGSVDYTRSFSLDAHLVEPWPGYVNDQTPMSEALYCSRGIRIGSIGLIEDGNGLGTIADVQPYWVMKASKKYGDKPFLTIQEKHSSQDNDVEYHFARAIVAYLVARGPDCEPVVGGGLTEVGSDYFFQETTIQVDAGENELLRNLSVVIRESNKQEAFNVHFKVPESSLLRSDGRFVVPLNMRRYRQDKLTEAMEHIHKFLYEGTLPDAGGRLGKEVTIKQMTSGPAMGRIVGTFRDTINNGSEVTVGYPLQTDMFTIGKDVIRYLNAGVLPNQGQF